MVMTPASPKKEEDIAAALESWITELRLLETHGQAYKLAHMFKMTALKIIMQIKEDHFDQIRKSNQGSNEEEELNGVVKDIMEYANRTWKRR